MNQEHSTAETVLEGGTYEIIRGRLQAQKAGLLERLRKLNDVRKDVFGSIETKLIANNRIQTENSCISRDIVSIGNLCIFGYNVHFGLRTEIKLDDVFSVFSYEDGNFKHVTLNTISDAGFIDDFVNLYRYYRNTRFYKFSIIGNYLYMVFQLSESLTDIKTFKWLIKENNLVYVDNRSDHEYRFPNQHDFSWVQTTRDMQKYGKYPHVSILDKVFVETIGGDLTIKVEDNTNKGKGIYHEPVSHPDQTLDDGGFRYADLGNLLALEIKPFQEEARYFVYNHKLKEVQKIDSIKSSAILLPDNQGLVFSNGYYLQSGEYKIFENSLSNVKFQERLASPNGEDFMYVFFEALLGRYVLIQYNIISQSVKTPIICNGYTILKNGELCYFVSEEEQTKNHVIQIWQTPFIQGNIISPVHKDSYVFKIGNKDIVKAMADCQMVITLLNKEDNYSGLYNDLARFAQNILDSYYWIDTEETFRLSIPLAEIKNTAGAAIDEFEKVVQLRQAAQKATQQTKEKALALFGKIKSASFAGIDDFVMVLTSLRKLHGEVISLKDVRYIDAGFISGLEKEIAEQSDKVSRHCVQFLLDDKALAPYQQRVEEKRKVLETVAKVVEGKKLEEETIQITQDLEMLIETVTNLKIEDTSQSTKIIESISSIFSGLNQLKAAVKNKIQSLAGSEASADFAAQIKLASQAIANYLDMADTPEKADELQNKVFVQLEDLEARFAGFDQFIAAIMEKREEVHTAFDAKKNSLVEARNKKAIALESAAQRILKGVAKKALGFNSAEEINGYFAADMMIGKLRDLVEQLHGLNDTGKAEMIETGLKSAKEDALRKLKDRQELYEDGNSIIKLGKHKFSVNQQVLDLTIVYKNGSLFAHLTGTDFYQQIKNDTLSASQKYWGQELVSENEKVYRSAYLAYKIFLRLQANPAAAHADEALLELVKEETSQSYTEGYIKGVHDADAFRLLKVLLNKHHDLGLLRYTPQQRAFGRFFWNSMLAEERQLWNKRIKAAGEVQAAFPTGKSYRQTIDALEKRLTIFTAESQLLARHPTDIAAIASYLFDELKTDDSFCISFKAAKLLEKFEATLADKNADTAFRHSIENSALIDEKIQLASQWVSAFLSEQANPENNDYLFEIVALLLFRHESFDNIISEHPVQVVEGIAGSHPSIEEGRLTFNYHAFMQLLSGYFAAEAPAFESFRKERHHITTQLKEELRLSEFEPKVLTSFVRNKLIDQVYLPLFGDNLAKQLGAAGENKRTDRSGMLLLVSPPGYGKTTLMEYIANRLGLAFMKINGPALGHDITSVDPLSANNSAAREELKKLNLALEMGNNVMLYIDDIQHCSPEFLQKFISLADGTRKMEGVYNGRPKTYDMKTKRFCVVMAGNPYTESGEKFKIPDMLANRSDIYNLGDIIGNTADLFKLSLVENALTANPVLSQLAARNAGDLYAFISAAENGTIEGLDLKGSYSKQETETYLSLLGKVLKVRDTLLKVNEAYIKSAAMDDAYRTEPPFKLQGSYRDMNKLVAKIVAVMNNEELQTLLLTHYENESQTLTSAAEANLLKYKELAGVLTEAEQARWSSIKETFQKNNKLKGLGGENGMMQILSQMIEFTEHVEGIKEALKTGIQKAAGNKM
ncbi:DNA repair ATPase [Foetidibacter luteolus]|uniref:DNA repair ATPase n=1 Tax=Foetidibacter luteolus TaxID=2608880 RepID=UPI00129B0954|nr:DNA repair ATPase [Foetidibacter luteolus]